MKNLGLARAALVLSSRPPVTFAAKAGGGGAETPIFEPYEEELPLQSGYYTFVIDALGRFRVKWGNTSSHASLVDRRPVASAGSFRIERTGRLAEVFCQSHNYRIAYRDQHDRPVVYTIESFVKHPAFNASPHLVFHFSRGLADRFLLDRDGNLLSDEQYREKMLLLEDEGVVSHQRNVFGEQQAEAFLAYVPAPPERLHSIHLDQAIASLEDLGDLGITTVADPVARFSTDFPVIPTGKLNFILDKEGWLVIGVKHHHLLAGGDSVGGAGHLVLDDEARVVEVRLNFSGHYRPELTAEYARYVHRTLRAHPLLVFRPECRIYGRKFDEATYRSVAIEFSASELDSDGPEFDEELERILI